MSNNTTTDRLEKDILRSLEADVSRRAERAGRINLQNVIPNHWFSAAASECAGMYIAGFFYGAISVAQAYVEALSRYLCDYHGNKGIKNKPEKRWEWLRDKKRISTSACDAALSIFLTRNDFHHLNKDVEQDYLNLETLAQACINHLHTIESEVFGYSFSNERPGVLVVHNPAYWPEESPGIAKMNLRQLW